MNQIGSSIIFCARFHGLVCFDILRYQNAATENNNDLYQEMIDLTHFIRVVSFLYTLKTENWCFQGV